MEPLGRDLWGPDGPEEGAGPVIRDRRRIDPATGAVKPGSASGSGRGPAAPAAAAAVDVTAEPGLDANAVLLAERTADLQRLKAEYDNYRRRVERDRAAVADQALVSVLLGLLPVLDSIDRAEEHGELTGGFKSVAETLDGSLSRLGLIRYGAAGEPFDPVVHEALMHSYSAEVTEPTCVAVLQPGYRLGERVLRPARVAVAEPDPAAAATDSVRVATDSATTAAVADEYEAAAERATESEFADLAGGDWPTGDDVADDDLPADDVPRGRA